MEIYIIEDKATCKPVKYGLRGDGRKGFVIHNKGFVVGYETREEAEKFRSGFTHPNSFHVVKLRSYATEEKQEKQS